VDLERMAMTKKKAAKKSAKASKRKPKRVTIALQPIRDRLQRGIRKLETAIVEAKGSGGSKSSIKRAQKRLKGMRAAVGSIGDCTDGVMSSISFDI
jgi:hypothetical protein